MDEKFYDKFGRIVLTHHDTEDMIRSIGNEVSKMGDRIRSGEDDKDIESGISEIKTKLDILQLSIDEYKKLVNGDSNGKIN